MRSPLRNYNFSIEDLFLLLKTLIKTVKKSGAYKISTPLNLTEPLVIHEGLINFRPFYLDYNGCMKTIVCYGDSNTYGLDPRSHERYDNDLLWTSILNKLLGDEYVVYNEGLNGRTTAYDRDGSDDRNGLKKLDECLSKYNSIDILVFMLGTNDCNYDLYLSVDDIKDGMEELIIRAKELLGDCKIIVISPAAILSCYKEGPYAYQLNDDSVYKSNQLGVEYNKLCLKFNCIHLDCTNELEVTRIDSEHLTINGHKRLAELLYSVIKERSL